MSRALPDALVTGFEGLIEAFDLPDPDNRQSAKDEGKLCTDLFGLVR